MGIQKDNAIIDFAAISDITTLLQSHEDTFSAFESENVLTATGLDKIATPINIIGMKIATVLISTTVGTSELVNFGITFSSKPVIIATVEGSSPKGIVAQITSAVDTTTSTMASYGGCTITTIDAATNTSGAKVTLHVLVIGQA